MSKKHKDVKISTCGGGALTYEALKHYGQIISVDSSEAMEISKYEEYKHDLNTIEVTMKLQCNKEYNDIKECFKSINKLVEKEKPKKVLHKIYDGILDMYVGLCPVCNQEVYENKCCENNKCRQKLDWSE